MLYLWSLKPNLTLFGCKCFISRLSYVHTCCSTQARVADTFTRWADPDLEDSEVGTKGKKKSHLNENYPRKLVRFMCVSPLKRSSFVEKFSCKFMIENWQVVCIRSESENARILLWQEWKQSQRRNVLSGNNKYTKFHR